eukprot:8043061-Pyramimonas_sp.AAC.1
MLAAPSRIRPAPTANEGPPEVKTGSGPRAPCEDSSRDTGEAPSLDSLGIALFAGPPQLGAEKGEMRQQLVRRRLSPQRTVLPKVLMHGHGGHGADFHA